MIYKGHILSSYSGAVSQKIHCYKVNKNKSKSTDYRTHTFSNKTCNRMELN